MIMECALFLILFVVIYIITVVICMYITYKEHRRVTTIGEVFDSMYIWMIMPLINTIALIIFALCLYIHLIIKYTGIIKLWEKIRNIKL